MTEGHAYRCYCSTERLQAERAAAEARGEAWQDDFGAVCPLGRNDIARLEASGIPRAVRVRVPPGETTFDDLVHGPITIYYATIEDFVILRSDGQPQGPAVRGLRRHRHGDYRRRPRRRSHLQHTEADSVVLRAGYGLCLRFAHVPLILGPDKKRLSKRHGATSVTEYQRQGYLPEAMVNFLALLGWSPGGDLVALLTRRSWR